MFKSHFGETVTVVLAIVMGFIMALASILANQRALNISSVFQIWSMITLVIILVSIIFPYKDWSEKFTSLFHVGEKSLSYKLIDNILPSLLLNTCNTLIVSAANIFYNEAIPAGAWMEEWMKGIIHDWPIMFVVSYLAAFAAEAAGKWVAQKYCK